MVVDREGGGADERATSVGGSAAVDGVLVGCVDRYGDESGPTIVVPFDGECRAAGAAVAVVVVVAVVRCRAESRGLMRSAKLNRLAGEATEDDEDDDDDDADDDDEEEDEEEDEVERFAGNRFGDRITAGCGGACTSSSSSISS